MDSNFNKYTVVSMHTGITNKKWKVCDGMPELVSRSKGIWGTAVNKCITEEEIYRIWESIGGLIAGYLKRQKATLIPGLGTFTFAHVPLEIGQRKFLFTQKPIFAPNERLLRNYGVRYTKKLVAGYIPLFKLNLYDVGADTHTNRDKVDFVVREVLAALNRSIRQRLDTNLTIPHVGTLEVRGVKAKMIFSRECLDNVMEKRAITRVIRQTVIPNERLCVQ